MLKDIKIFQRVNGHLVVKTLLFLEVVVLEVDVGLGENFVNFFKKIHLKGLDLCVELKQEKTHQIDVDVVDVILLYFFDEIVVHFVQFLKKVQNNLSLNINRLQVFFAQFVGRILMSSCLEKLFELVLIFMNEGEIELPSFNKQLHTVVQVLFFLFAQLHLFQIGEQGLYHFN